MCGPDKLLLLLGKVAAKNIRCPLVATRPRPSAMSMYLKTSVVANLSCWPCEVSVSSEASAADINEAGDAIVSSGSRSDQRPSVGVADGDDDRVAYSPDSFD